MTHILVAGLVNVEMTVAIDGFPINYAPVRYNMHGIKSSVSGVGFNIAKALTTLGNHVDFLTMLGDDTAGHLIENELTTLGISTEYVSRQLDSSPQSAILYTPDGERAIYTDLKDIQEQVYPVQSFEQSLSKTQIAVLANINFSRPLLSLAQQAGIPIATDIHAISDINDDYNRDYMRHATILFQSHENLPMSPDEWIQLVWKTYGTPIVVVGLGADGAKIGVRKDNRVQYIPAVYTRPVINTIGAGDSLFSSFVHTYAKTHDPYLAIKKAVVFASYKVGGNGGADGFLSADELDEWYARIEQGG